MLAAPVFTIDRKYKVDVTSSNFDESGNVTSRSERTEERVKPTRRTYATEQAANAAAAEFKKKFPLSEWVVRPL